MLRFLYGLAALVGTAASTPAAVQPQAPAAAPPSAAASAGHPSEVSIPDTRRIAFVSRINGHSYSIDVALPEVPPPPKGYPVIYVLDGDAYFGAMAEAVRVNDNAPQAVVVGIGYPRDPVWATSVLARHQPLPPEFATAPPFDAAESLERMYDMGLPMNEAELKEASATGASLTARNVGGMDDFLKTIETEVKPRVYALAPINRADQTLFGHSLGGLAVLEALFTEPTAFRTFVAASPSIWWADKEVLRNEAAFSARVADGRATPRVLVTVGAEEETLPKNLPPPMAALKMKLEALVKRARMVGNACDLALRLRSLHGAAGYEVAPCAVFPAQAHGISVWPAMGRAVSFAFPQ